MVAYTSWPPEVNILKVDVPRENGKGWKRTAVEIDAQDPALGAGWREQAASGAQYIIQETWVKANDPHFDAKVWPGLHPHGTGSVLSEPGSGSLKGHARNRAGGIQSLFRRCAVWAFWFLDRLLLGRNLHVSFCSGSVSTCCILPSTGIIKNDLFNLNSRRRRRGRSASAQDDPDGFTRNFGMAVPANIPEESTIFRNVIFRASYPFLRPSARTYGKEEDAFKSSAWWKVQSKDLFAITEEGEMGMMQCMVTITHNDRVPELLATIRRGPFAEPTETEQVEYLFTRVKAKREALAFENYAFEHVLSYQRRIQATKEHFMRRNTKTPLGIMQDWWDRTEAQMRRLMERNKQRFTPPGAPRDPQISMMSCAGGGLVGFVRNPLRRRNIVKLL